MTPPPGYSLERAEDRALVEAFLEARGVTRCAAGVRAIDLTAPDAWAERQQRQYERHRRDMRFRRLAERAERESGAWREQGGRPGRAPALCAHPGCGRALGPKNGSGVCAEHVHKEGCRCAWCALRLALKGGEGNG